MISATSKVTVPRKKILAEKNESLTSSDNIPFQKFSILESRNNLLHLVSGPSHCDRTSSRAISACNCTSSTADDELNTCFADSSLRPYDPLTNYCSPRPKYLRYKPNRRLEILQRSGVFYSQNSKIVVEEKYLECDREYLNPPQEGSSQIMKVKGRDNSNDCQEAKDEEEEEESEEFEEVKSWSWKGLLKYLLLVIFIGLPTAYISTMNSPRPSAIVQAIGGLRDSYHRIQNHLFEAVSTNVYSGAWKNGSGVLTGDGQTSFVEVKNQCRNHDFGRLQIDLYDEEEMEEGKDQMVEMLEPPSGQFEDICDDDDERDDGFNWPDWKFAEIQDTDGEVKELGEESDQFPGWESAQTDGTDQELKMLEEGFETLVLCERRDDAESASGNELANLLYQGEDLETEQKDDQLEESFGEKEGEEISGIRPERADDITTCMEDKNYHKVEEMGRISVAKAGQGTIKTKLHIFEATASNMEDENLDYTELDTSRSEVEVKSMKVANNVDFRPIPIAAMWFCVFSIILASLVYLYALRPIQAPLHDSPLEVPERKEKLIQVHPNVKVVHTEGKAESVVKNSSVDLSFEEPTNGFMHAPDVELVGEFEIGEFSRSLRSCGRKGRTVEFDKCSNPISSLESRVQFVAQAQTLNVSNTDSPSYGSFTAEKIICRKQVKFNISNTANL